MVARDNLTSRANLPNTQLNAASSFSNVGNWSLTVNLNTQEHHQCPRSPLPFSDASIGCDNHYIRYSNSNTYLHARYSRPLSNLLPLYILRICQLLCPSSYINSLCFQNTQLLVSTSCGTLLTSTLASFYECLNSSSVSGRSSFSSKYNSHVTHKEGIHKHQPRKGLSSFYIILFSHDTHIRPFPCRKHAGSQTQTYSFSHEQHTTEARFIHLSCSTWSKRHTYLPRDPQSNHLVVSRRTRDPSFSSFFYPLPTSHNLPLELLDQSLLSKVTYDFHC